MRLSLDVVGDAEGWPQRGLAPENSRHLFLAVPLAHFRSVSKLRRRRVNVSRAVHLTNHPKPAAGEE
jgi:hypothetical protein